MKLFLVGANSPAGKGLIEILRKNKIRFLAPADKNFDLINTGSIPKMIVDFAPTQLINMADFISRNHSALKRAESSEQRCERINSLLPATLAKICNSARYSHVCTFLTLTFSMVRKNWGTTKMTKQTLRAFMAITHCPASKPYEIILSI